MKHLLLALSLLISTISYSQKYVLIDKKMSEPLAYTNTVTLQHSYKNFFAVEKDKIKQFLLEVEKISAILTDKKKPKPESLEFNVGKTRFVGIKIPLAAEERLDVVLTTDCDGNKIYMHLSDAKISNANNAFFINTWVKYIRGGLSPNK
jgi:hypothetical protein